MPDDDPAELLIAALECISKKLDEILDLLRKQAGEPQRALGH